MPPVRRGRHSGMPRHVPHFGGVICINGEEFARDLEIRAGMRDEVF